MSVLPTAVTRGKPNPLHFTFPDRLRKMRKAAGLTGAALSRAAGINEDAAARIEGGRWAPRLDTVERLADALRVSPGWLAYGVEGEWAAAEGLRCMQAGARVRMVREAAGLSLNKVGRLAESSAAAVLGVERGKMPALDTLEQLAKALGVSPAWLAFGVGPQDLPRRGTRREPSVEGPLA